MMEYASGGDLRNLIRKLKSEGGIFHEEDILCEHLGIMNSNFIPIDKS